MRSGNVSKGQGGNVIVDVLLTVLLLAALGFGGWAFMQMQDYKNNVDQKINAAVVENTKTVQAQDAKQYAEDAKNPLKTFAGPEAYGSVVLQYPKTWSSYVDTSNTSQPLDFYAQPDVVNSTNTRGVAYALRMRVLAQAYSQVLNPYQNLQKQGKVTAEPFTLKNVPSITGVRLQGQLTSSVQGIMVILPLRDKTLMIWTESSQFADDFTNKVLPSASFSP